MAIIPKQIGWSNESNLIWELLRKVDQLVKVTSTSGGGPCGDCPVTADGVTITGNGTTGSPLVATTAPIPSLQQVLDTNHDLTDDNNFQGTGAGSGITGSPTAINAFGGNAAFESSGSDVNAFGKDAAKNNIANDVNAFGKGAGYGNSYSSVNLFGPQASATAGKQLVLSTGTYNTRIGYGVNGDRLFEFPKDVDGTFALTGYYDIIINNNIMLTPGFYDLVTPSFDPSTNNIYVPNPTLMKGQRITIWNRSGNSTNVFAFSGTTLCNAASLCLSSYILSDDTAIELIAGDAYWLFI